MQRCARLSKVCIPMANIDRSCLSLHGAPPTTDPSILLPSSSLGLQRKIRRRGESFFHPGANEPFRRECLEVGQRYVSPNTRGSIPPSDASREQGRASV